MRYKDLKLGYKSRKFASEACQGRYMLSLRSERETCSTTKKKLVAAATAACYRVASSGPSGQTPNNAALPSQEAQQQDPQPM